MKKTNLLLGALTTFTISANAFCGFYVAKADGKLFNKSSQVILVRNSETNRNTITMANDYQGDFSEFAMVVPVPVVLKENEIKVVQKDLFERFDSYSAPRLAEYFDRNPCYVAKRRCKEMAMMDSNFKMTEEEESIMNKKYEGVKIEAKYEIGEYDILILSATESNGLKNWLTDNEYKIPSEADEVLTPYIKNNMKFFVAKVNTKRLNQRRGDYLSPIQISFTHKKFMLPIRLGMANADGTQDLIVYALTQNGRVETSNYRTQEMPSNQKIPLFVEGVFGDFYKSVFSKKWTNNKSSVFVEYAWDLDGKNFTKCDPCNTTPPASQELLNAGVDWLKVKQNNWVANYQGNLHFTRLHVRYDREHFPQDLAFTETKNKQNFQCRYVLNHPAKISDKTCDQVLPYYKNVQKRRGEEMNNLTNITWWEADRYQAYLKKYKTKIASLEVQEEEEKNSFLPVFPKGNIPAQSLIFSAGISLSLCLIFGVAFTKKKQL
jgi:hypothetical protein